MRIREEKEDGKEVREVAHVTRHHRVIGFTLNKKGRRWRMLRMGVMGLKNFILLFCSIYYSKHAIKKCHNTVEKE